MSDTTTAAAEPITLQAFVPAELRIGDNARTDAEATITKEWVAQLKEHAKHSPLLYPAPDGTLVTCGNNTAVPLFRCPDGALEILFGARRTLGCIAAGVYLLGYIAGDKGDDRAARRARLIDQLTENTGRVPMRRSDEAAVILKLIDDEDMTEAGIVRATGLSRPEVAAYRAVARSALAAKAADRWAFLTLDQAAILAEFERDEQALTYLVQTAQHNPGQFDHVVAQLRAARDEREAKAAFTAELEAQGFAIYGEGSRVPWTLALENLRDGDGNEITPEAHATCPGRAVTITTDWGWAPGAEAAYRAAHGLADDDDLADVEFASDEDALEAGYAERWQISRHLCTDPEQYGHANALGQPVETPTSEQQTAEAEADAAAAKTEERRRVRLRNTEWRAATEVRTDHLKALLARKVPPAGALRLIVEAMARGETQPLMSSFGHQTACELLGLTGDGAAASHRDLLLAELARASEKRAQVIALAMVLGAAEHGVRDVHTWQSAPYWSRHSIPAAARYLAWLAEHAGYALSDIEAEVAALATARPDEPAGEAEGTDPDPAEDEREWDSEDSNAYQDQVEAGQVTEEDPASAEAD